MNRRLVLAFLLMAQPRWMAPSRAAAAPAGAIRGTVSDAEFDGPVPQAVVRVLELNVQGETGADGYFLFEAVPAGSYTLTIAKPGYERQMLASVVVAGGAMAEVAVRLKGEFVEMEEFVVRDLDLGDTTTEMGLLTLREMSVSFQDSIGADLIKRAGASDAAGALRLVVGTSVVDDKFATVRGLSDRYVGAAVNDIRVPSSDPKKRAVHMDVFPAGTIDSISVAKTFTPDLPGDYSGGGVSIRTISIPDEPFFKASFAREINRETTGKDSFVTYEGAGAGRWGRHRGSRDMPSGAGEMEEDDLTDKGLESHHDEQASRENPHGEKYRKYDKIVRSMAPAMGVTREKVPPNYSQDVSAGGSFGLGNGWKAGAMGAFTYSKKYTQREIDETELLKPPETNPGDTNVYEFVRSTGTEEVKWSEIASGGIGNDDHEVSVTGIRNRAATDRASVKIEEHDEDDSFWRQQQAIHYTERSIDILQFRGTHNWDSFFGDVMGLELDWFGARNIAEQEEPDVRNFQNVVVEREGGMWEYQPRPDGTAGADEDSSTRIWRNTKEDNSLYGVSVGFPFDYQVPDVHAAFRGADESVWSEEQARLKLGTVRDWTRRDYTQDSFYYSFATQQPPTYTGPVRSEFPPGRAGFLQWQAARAAWLESPDGIRYTGALEDAEEDNEKRTFTTDNPDALWTDVFTDADRIGVGSYQDSMFWYVLPKFRDVSYAGDQNFRSGFWMLELPVTKQLKLMCGARLEGTQIMINPSSDLEADDPEKAFLVPVTNTITNEDGSVTVYYTLDGVSKEEAAAEIDESEWLRSAGATYQLVETMNLRLNWGQTIARPTFLELAPVITYDFIDDETFVGNDELVISHLDNYDLRWEWFRRPGEVLAASWFYKTISDPIERLSFGYLGRDYLLAVNYPEGYIRGAEFEGRKTLDFLPGMLRYLGVGANYTMIDSSVEIPEQQQNSLEFHGLGQERRDMEGQPEYLANLNLTYDNDRWGTSVGLFYNFIGDMLRSGAAVGDEGATPNIYAKDYQTVNLTISQGLGKNWRVVFKAMNLTDPLIGEVYREPDETEEHRRSYERGVLYSMGLGCTW